MQYYNGMGCSGKNISPALSWENAPKNTKSFAITVFDPDVPIETGWTHWIIFNIPHNVNGLKAGAGNVALKNYPQGSIQSVTSFGSTGYGGPCPLKNSSHKVIFTLYALNVNKLQAYNHLVTAISTPAQVGIALYKHTIAKASFISYSSR